MKNAIDRPVNLSDAELAAELARSGAAFIAFSDEDLPPASPSPDVLLAALAERDSARLRLAFIPLFLARPDYAQSVRTAATSLSGSGRVTLICYYTAAMLLQRKYARRLAGLGHHHDRLPDLFGSELGLPASGEPDTLLASLAERHTELSGRNLNWLGTYDHAAQLYFQQLESDPTWTKRPTIVRLAHS